MRNYKKYRSTVLNLFQSFLAEKINKTNLMYELKKIERFDLQGKVLNTKKSLWFKFFDGDTGATDIQNIDYGIGNATNDKYYRECMQISIDNPKELKIYYS